MEIISSLYKVVTIVGTTYEFYANSIDDAFHMGKEHMENINNVSEIIKIECIARSEL